MSYRFSDQIDPADFESELIFKFLITKTYVSGNFMYKHTCIKMHPSFPASFQRCCIFHLWILAKDAQKMFLKFTLL